MAYFAPVAPGHILQAMSYDVFGSYHLLLAHETVKAPAEYEFFKKRNTRYVIMDNSVAELGVAVGYEAVSEAQKITSANIVVLPDAYNDSKGTVELYKEHIETWFHHFKGKAQLMVVPQGETFEKWLWCCEQLAKDHRIDWWGIPRNIIDKKLHYTRYYATRYARLQNPKRSIHLLGFTDDIHDDLQCASDPHVAGIDSAVPLRMASMGLDFSVSHFNATTNKMPGRGDWWQTAMLDHRMEENIKEVRRLVANGY